ncbi:MAG: PDZ domain-containing protein [Chloroflexota bacterium]
MGVPVITAGNDVVVGFDRPRLERIAARYARPQEPAEEEPPKPRVKLGAGVRDAGGGGVELGEVRPGSAADRAGLRRGDILLRFRGSLIRKAADLETGMAAVDPGASVPVVYLRDGMLVEATLEFEPE